MLTTPQLAKAIQEALADAAAKSTAARADQSVSMLNPLLAVVDENRGFGWSAWRW